MKNLFLLASLIAVSLGFSSCCSMFSHGSGAQYRTETRQVATGKYDIVTEQISTGGKDGLTETVEKKVPRYKTVTKKIKVKCTSCTRFYCPKKDACGTTAESTQRLATVQGGTGSPNLGLIPTMKPLAP